jgi:hypothetical protein
MPTLKQHYIKVLNGLVFRHRQNLLSGSYELDSQLSDPTRGWKFNDKLSEHQILNNDSISWKILVVSCKWKPAVAARKTHKFLPAFKK